MQAGGATARALRSVACSASMPYDMPMARVQTMVQLSDDLVSALDQEAARRGASRSELIRHILGVFLHETQAASIGRQIADGYARIPPATPDEWGDLGDATDRATADLLHRLDADERQAGHTSW